MENSATRRWAAAACGMQRAAQWSRMKWNFLDIFLQFLQIKIKFVSKAVRGKDNLKMCEIIRFFRAFKMSQITKYQRRSNMFSDKKTKQNRHFLFVQESVLFDSVCGGTA